MDPLDDKHGEAFKLPLRIRHWNTALGDTGDFEGHTAIEDANGDQLCEWHDASDWQERTASMIVDSINAGGVWVAGKRTTVPFAVSHVAAIPMLAVDTPRTNALMDVTSPIGFKGQEMVNLARQLERELADMARIAFSSDPEEIAAARSSTRGIEALLAALRNVASYSGHGPHTTPWQSIVRGLGEQAREALKAYEAAPASAIAATPFEEVYAANGKVSYEDVEHTRPITCQRNCRMPSSPIWWTFGENHGNADHGFTSMMKHLNGKRVRVTISLHKDDFPPKSATPDGRAKP
jgi:hypothetical protein